MTRAFFVILLLAAPFVSKADAWDNLTKENADKVYKFLQKNPFVFDYCDCCGAETGASLILINSMEIKACSWKPEDFTIHYVGTTIATFFRENDGGINPTEVSLVNEEVSGDIYMNYTWVYHHKHKLVMPLFESVAYDMYGPDNSACTDFFELPSAKLIGNKKYKKWAKRA